MTIEKFYDLNIIRITWLPRCDYLKGTEKSLSVNVIHRDMMFLLHIFCLNEWYVLMVNSHSFLKSMDFNINNVFLKVHFCTKLLKLQKKRGETKLIFKIKILTHDLFEFSTQCPINWFHIMLYTTLWAKQTTWML